MNRGLLLLLSSLFAIVPSIYGGIILGGGIQKSYIAHDLTHGLCNIDYSHKSITVVFGLQQRNLDQLEKVFWDVSTPSSPSYGAHLTFEELHDLIEPHPSEVEKVRTWIMSHGVSADQIVQHEARDHLSANMTIDAAERMFGTKYTLYSDPGSKHFWLKTSKYEVPDHLGIRAIFSEAKLTIEQKCRGQLRTRPTNHIANSESVHAANQPSSHHVRSGPNYVDRALQDIKNTNAPYPIYTFGFYQFIVIRCPDGSYADGSLNCQNGDKVTQLIISSYFFNNGSLFDVNTYNIFYGSSCQNDYDCNFRHVGWGLPSNNVYFITYNYGPSRPIPDFTPLYFSYSTITTSGNQTTTLIVDYAPKITYIDLSVSAFKSMYGIPLNYTATNPNSSQGVIEFNSAFYSPSDLQQFLNSQGLPDYSSKVIFTGPDTNCPCNQNGEGQLDVNLIMSIGLNITTYFYLDDSPNDQFGDGSGNGWLFRALNDPKGFAYVQSVSWGLGPEFPSSTAYYDTEFMKAGARGITVLVAGGDYSQWDNGVGTDPTNIPAPNKNEPAASAYVTVVGGTMAVHNGTALTEWLCSAQYGAFYSAGSGLSQYASQPWYQTEKFNNYVSNYVGAVPSAYNLANRAYPDVSAVSLNLASIFKGQSTSVSGTSASTPVFSAVVALLNDIRLNQGQPPLGFLNPLLYALPSDAFNDVVMGNSACVQEYCGPFGFSAAPGYDIPTGLGTPNFPKLAEYIRLLKNSSASASASVSSTILASTSATIASTSSSTLATSSSTAFLASSSSSSSIFSSTSSSSSATLKASSSSSSAQSSTLAATSSKLATSTSSASLVSTKAQTSSSSASIAASNRATTSSSTVQAAATRASTSSSSASTRATLTGSVAATTSSSAAAKTSTKTSTTA